MSAVTEPEHYLGRFVVHRTEREVAADTLYRLIVEGLVLDRASATAAAGLTFPDVEAAQQRHKKRGFLAPLDEPASAASVEPTNQQADAVRHRASYVRAHPSPGMRRCVGCGEEKPEAEFPWKDKARGYRHSRCSPCQNEKQRTRYLSVSKTKMLNEVGLAFVAGEADELTNLCCLECGCPIRPGEEVHGRTALRHTTCPTAVPDA